MFFIIRLNTNDKNQKFTCKCGSSKNASNEDFSLENVFRVQEMSKISTTKIPTEQTNEYATKSLTTLKNQVNLQNTMQPTIEYISTDFADNLSIIVGICLALAIIISVLLIFSVFKKKKSKEEAEASEQDYPFLNVKGYVKCDRVDDIDLSQGNFDPSSGINPHKNTKTI